MIPLIMVCKNFSLDTIEFVQMDSTYITSHFHWLWSSVNYNMIKFNQTEYKSNSAQNNNTRIWSHFKILRGKQR